MALQRQHFSTLCTSHFGSPGLNLENKTVFIKAYVIKEYLSVAANHTLRIM